MSEIVTHRPASHPRNIPAKGRSRSSDGPVTQRLTHWRVDSGQQCAKWFKRKTFFRKSHHNDHINHLVWNQGVEPASATSTEPATGFCAAGAEAKFREHVLRKLAKSGTECSS